MTHCPNCRVGIRGDYHVEEVFVLNAHYTPPAYCFNCGNPFEWTKRKIAGAVDLLEIGADVTPVELQQFRTDLTDATRDTPKTQVASLRIRNLMAKVGTSVAGGVREIVIDLVSETAKKIIWGPGA
jgi:hypothetical protein